MPENRDIEPRDPDDIERRKDNLVRRSLEYLKEFEEQGLANVEQPDLDGWNLHYAAYVHELDISSALIATGDDVDARNKNGNTPLHWAVQSNNLEGAHLLVDSGAEIDAKNNIGWTHLDWASEKNSLEMASLLIKSGAHTDGIDLSWMNDQEDA